MGSLHLEILFGICLIYGAMGSFDVIEISALSQSAELPVWFYRIILVTIGMLFKVGSSISLLGTRCL
jgi:NADH-quinone oxidoreductase subunit N